MQDACGVLSRSDSAVPCAYVVYTEWLPHSHAGQPVISAHSRSLHNECLPRMALHYGIPDIGMLLGNNGR